MTQGTCPSASNTFIAGGVWPLVTQLSTDTGAAVEEGGGGAWGLYLPTGGIDDGAPRSLGTATAHGTPSVGCNELGILTWGCCAGACVHHLDLSPPFLPCQCQVWSGTCNHSD